MTDKISFVYTDDRGRNISFDTSEEECNLTQLMACFIDFTRMIGYHPNSWGNVINSINADGGLTENYTAFDWASDIFMDMGD